MKGELGQGRDRKEGWKSDGAAAALGGAREQNEGGKKRTMLLNGQRRESSRKKAFKSPCPFLPHRLVSTRRLALPLFCTASSPLSCHSPPAI